MNSTGLRGWALAGVIGVFATVGGIATASVATAAPDSDAATAPIQEYRTVGDKGWFYTLDKAEGRRAASENGFTHSATYGELKTEPGPGTTPIHRLRAKSGQSYMLSVSPQEFASGKFVDEGVFGYIDRTQHSGQQQLLRFSNHGKWRVLSDAPDNIKNMRKLGYTVDGPLGWAKP